MIVLDLLSFGPMALNKHVKAARNSVLETLKTQQKMERPVQPTYSHEDAVARAFMASNIIALITGVATPFAQEYISFLVLRFLMGIAYNTFFTMPYVLGRVSRPES